MPMICVVYGCFNRSNRETTRSFYRVPKVVVHKGEKCRKLTEKRRQTWLAVLGSGGAESENARVCSDHFVRGCPSALNDVESVDWVPSVNLGYQKEKPSSEPHCPPEKRMRCREYRGTAEAFLDLHEDVAETIHDRQESRPFRPFITESEDRKLNSLGKAAHTPARSQLWQYTPADEGSSGMEERLVCVVQQNVRVQNKPVKEKDEGYLCAETSSSLGRISPMDQNSGGEFDWKIVKEEEPEEDVCLSVDALSSAGHVIPGDQQDEEIVRITVKEEEPEDEDYQCGATSSSGGTSIHVDQQTEEFERNAVKNEEPEDDSYLYCSCRRNSGVSAPANNEQSDGTVSNGDLLKRLIAAQSSMSRQLAALSAQITEQTLLLQEALDEMRQRRDQKQPTSAPKKMKRAQSATVAKAAMCLHNSEKYPDRYDPQTEISSLQNQAVTTQLLNELSVSFTKAEPEIIKASCKTYCETVRRRYCLAQSQKARWRHAAENRQRRKRLLEARPTAVQT